MSAPTAKAALRLLTFPARPQPSTNQALQRACAQLAQLLVERPAAFETLAELIDDVAGDPWGRRRW